MQLRWVIGYPSCYLLLRIWSGHLNTLDNPVRRERPDAAELDPVDSIVPAEDIDVQNVCGDRGSDHQDRKKPVGTHVDLSLCRVVYKSHCGVGTKSRNGSDGQEEYDRRCPMHPVERCWFTGPRHRKQSDHPCRYAGDVKEYVFPPAITLVCKQDRPNSKQEANEVTPH